MNSYNSFCGDAEDQVGNTLGTHGTEKKTIRVILTRPGETETDEIFPGQHLEVKLEVPDTSNFPSSDEEEVDFGELDAKIKIESMEHNSSTSQSASDEEMSSDGDNNNPESLKKWNIGETLIKTEVVDLGHFSSSSIFIDEEVDEMESVSIPPKPKRNPKPSTSTSLYTCPQCPYESHYPRCVDKHLEVHSKNANSAPCRLCRVYILKTKRCSCGSTPLGFKKAKKKKKVSAPPKKKITKEELKERHNNPHYSSRVRMENSYPRLHFKCNYCPFTVKASVKGIENHVQLHISGTTAIPCDICGVYSLPERMGWHKSLRHRQLSKSVRKQMKVKEKETGRPKRNSNPDFIAAFDNRRKRFYKCRHCRFRNTQLGDMKSHVELHREGSGASTCEICKLVMLPEQMQPHLEAKHSVKVRQRTPDKRRANNYPVIECAHCPHQAQLRSKAEQHSKLHLEGSGASACPKCDVFFMPKPFTNLQHNCGKWQMRNRRKRVMLLDEKQEGCS